MKTLKNYIEKKGDFKESFVTSSFDFEGGHRWEQRKRRERLVKDKDYRSPFTNLFRIGKRIRMITFVYWSFCFAAVYKLHLLPPQSLHHHFTSVGSFSDVISQ